MGLTEDEMESGDLYKTRYYTWNNFGLEKEDKDLTSYQLMAYITDQIGIHEGTVFTYHQDALDHNETDTDKYLSDLELLQYDLLYGERYAYNGSRSVSEKQIWKWVWKDVKVTDYSVNSDNTQLIIEGENFTRGAMYMSMIQKFPQSLSAIRNFGSL